MTESIITVLPRTHLKTVFTNSFNYGSKAHSTELSKNFWELKRKDIYKSIKHWSVTDHAKPYMNESKRCNLSLTEKYHILTSPVNLNNKMSELISKCCHENKFYLINYKAISQIISKTESDR